MFGNAEVCAYVLVPVIGAGGGEIGAEDVGGLLFGALMVEDRAASRFGTLDNGVSNSSSVRVLLAVGLRRLLAAVLRIVFLAPVLHQVGDDRLGLHIDESGFAGHVEGDNLPRVEVYEVLAFGEVHDLSVDEPLRRELSQVVPDGVGAQSVAAGEPYGGDLVAMFCGLAAPRPLFREFEVENGER
jgi:hypothetical protein